MSCSTRSDRDLRKDDQFRLVHSGEYVDSLATGNTKLLPVGQDPRACPHPPLDGPEVIRSTLLDLILGVCLELGESGVLLLSLDGSGGLDGLGSAGGGGRVVGCLVVRVVDGSSSSLGSLRRRSHPADASSRPSGFRSCWRRAVPLAAVQREERGEMPWPLARSC